MRRQSTQFRESLLARVRIGKHKLLQPLLIVCSLYRLSGSSSESEMYALAEQVLVRAELGSLPIQSDSSTVASRRSPSSGSEEESDYLDSFPKLGKGDRASGMVEESVAIPSEATPRHPSSCLRRERHTFQSPVLGGVSLALGIIGITWMWNLFPHYRSGTQAWGRNPYEIVRRNNL